MEVLDPTHETEPTGGEAPARLDSMKGCTVGIISNGKEGAKAFFAHMEDVLRSEYGVAEVVQRVKQNYSAPAEAELMREAMGWDAVLSGVGD